MLEYITFNDINIEIYNLDGIDYNHPFIGINFINIYQYIKFCNNFNYYIRIEPIFIDKYNTEYPIMLLEDVEIHWINENNKEHIIKKYNIRRKLSKPDNQIFILTCWDLNKNISLNEYYNIVKDFSNNKNSIYLTKNINDLINTNIFLIKEWIETNFIINYFENIRYILKYRHKFSIIMPIKINNSNSFDIFTRLSLPLYKKHLEILFLDTFYVICPKDNYELLNNHIKNYKNYINFKFIFQEDLLINNIEIKGWYLQQILKLMISYQINTKYYLVVDSDMFLNQPIQYSDFFYNNKIKYHSEPWQEYNNKYYSTNSNWWKQSYDLLEYEKEEFDMIKKDNKLMSVTPQMLITDIVKDILNSFDALKLYKQPFTEFTLYWLYILYKRPDILNCYTNEGTPLWAHNLTTNILSYENTTEQLNIIKKSIENPSSFFTVVQSYLNADINNFINTIYKSYDL